MNGVDPSVQPVVLVFAIFLLAVIIAWIILPFAVLGTKPLLRQLIEETRKTNALLRRAEEPRQKQDPHL